MAQEDNQSVVAKITDQEPGLRDIYRRVFDALKNVNRSKYDAAPLAMLDSSLDAPETIEFEKLVAILKAIRGSTSDDKIQLETFYGMELQDGTMVGTLVGDAVKELGLDYSDLLAFVSETGWSKQP